MAYHISSGRFPITRDSNLNDNIALCTCYDLLNARLKQKARNDGAAPFCVAVRVKNFKVQPLLAEYVGGLSLWILDFLHEPEKNAPDYNTALSTVIV